jgi:hypothetical protein
MNDFVARAAVLIYCCPVNRLYFGDNLKRPRAAREFPDASVDLVFAISNSQF